MASGPVLGGDDGAKEKQRFSERKVYTRRVFRGRKKDPNAADAPESSKIDNAAAAATSTVTNENSNNSVLQNSTASEAKSNGDNVSVQLLARQQAVPEDGNSTQPLVGSGLEDGNSAQPLVGSGLEDGNLAQAVEGSGLEDGNLAQAVEGSGLEDGKSAQPLVGSGLEDGNLAQPQLENQNIVQVPVGSELEDGNTTLPQMDDPNMTQTQVSSLLEDGNTPQPQLDDQNITHTQGSLRLDDGNTVQPQVSSRSEDGDMAQPSVGSKSVDENMAQPQVSSRTEDENMAQPQVSSRTGDENMAQPQMSSRSEDGNMSQPQVSSRLEDGNTAQPQVISRSADANTSRPQVSSQLPDRKSPQPEVNSRLEDRNSPQQQVNSRLEDGVLPQPQMNSRLDADRVKPPVILVSDDSQQQDEPYSLQVQQEDDGPSSPSPQLEAVPSTRHLTLMNGDVERRQRDRIKINLASKSKQEMRELRWKLENELDVVRSLVNKIEVKQRQVGGYGNSNVSVGGGIDNVGGAKRAHSEVASAGVPRQLARPLHQLSLSMLENSQGISETVEKEKRTPKANQFYPNSEFLLAKDKFPPVESNKKSKLNWKKQGGGEMGLGFGMGSKLFKSCSSLLEKLMKHKHGWVFNAPVDVEGLGLHDYFTIITHPMDLGTVKSRLTKNWYKSPKEFAEDVRLTFRNAMTYNPKGQDVHVMAEQLSKIFEDRWVIIESEYNREMRYGFDYGAAPHAPSPLSRRVSAFTPPSLDMRRILDRSESLARTKKSMSITPSSRTPAPKKPKAKDPHKRDMTFEEKQKLSTNLQSLPSEKLDAIVQIIKKRNSALNQHDDEIEVDIDSVDAETLWELDRFVTNYKKSLSKNKRKAELARARAEALQQNAIQKSQAPAMVEIPKETQTDEINVSQSLPAQGGNQADNGSRSSSSSSSSSDSGSSSSDSDSDSSSASGSDAGSQGS
ncbi:hypothetical protein Fmac_021556 [Flemingia macrophylla]|uniref:Transcription factor GTE4-like n=1 Tax=Flemingia macrophylla TaxID=520843 RepID=A0ABD1LX69_9FABA